MHVAVTKGHIDAVRSLVKGGAGVFAIYTNCRTSLHLACAFGNPEIVRVLLLASLGPSDGRMRLASTIKECLVWEERSRATPG